ncbi:thermostable hemolysin [Piscinibacter sp. Jin2]|uniref:Thermostable hemolysin n=1 Tax=Aquariibacter lacus TaxID=2801332 RepID=A0A9X1BNL2_9BURK|nr:thermostable hemolysin [Piscinibacter lacus]MBL0720077.1 thermostable hemolysin [Piscinibacter lacus]
MQAATRPCLPLSSPDRAELCEHGPDDPRRAEVEACIRQVYAQRFGARVERFAPRLLGLRSTVDGTLLGAAGYRFADQPLYLERYLDAPVDQLLGEHGPQRPPRAEIAEIGHLCALRPGDGLRLIPAVAAHLHAAGVRWAACTLTEELRRLFLRLGLAPVALGSADPARLRPEERAAWGDYYSHHPVVIAGRLQPAVERLQAAAAARPGRLA